MQCNGCAHWRSFDGGNSMQACHFAYDMAVAGHIGVVREVSARECYKNKVHFKPVVVTRLREEAKRPKLRAGEPDAAPKKRVVLVCPGCFWAKGVGRRSICPRLGCGKVRRREETA